MSFNINNTESWSGCMYGWSTVHFENVKKTLQPNSKTKAFVTPYFLFTLAKEALEEFIKWAVHFAKNAAKDEAAKLIANLGRELIREILGKSSSLNSSWTEVDLLKALSWLTQSQLQELFAIANVTNLDKSNKEHYVHLILRMAAAAQFERDGLKVDYQRLDVATSTKTLIARLKRQMGPTYLTQIAPDIYIFTSNDPF